MSTIAYEWETPDGTRRLEMARVEGTQGQPYLFGSFTEPRRIEVSEFWIATVPVTQAFWMHVLGNEECPAIARGPQRPVENVSWDALTLPGGFLDRLNASAVREQLCASASLPGGMFRLPSETEWEYAARGGPQWRDGFRYSGSNDIDTVAWYDRKHGDHVQDVALKRPNQLGLYDMSGNLWEWCQDTYVEDVQQIPADGRPLVEGGAERVLRGGCYHNWAMHCTVSKRYFIDRHYQDECIGFRPVLAAQRGLEVKVGTTQLKDER